MPEHAEKPLGVENGPIEVLDIHIPLDTLYRSILKEYGCTLVPLRREKRADPACRIVFPPGVRIERDESWGTREATRYDLFFPGDFYFTWYRNQQGDQVWNSLNIPLYDLPIKRK